ncbi:copper chaperone PCu(A)C [Allosphingosinicella flava]|uniref:Copper chaperone PCu(A)C n=1 Tax=Allosphingosinicella flava TaxID=2771430 RepID=A0A7T2GKM9_9SPHN|nr:copper chaperone PCu(A)C [Sphingosinicella flava]QPQ55278.1 copper chaperone PCu(A)C [Sphingosinicella flava]
MRRLFVPTSAALLLMLAGCDAPNAQGNAAAGGNEAAVIAQSGGIGISNAFVRLPAVAGRPGAAYFTLRNEGEARILASVSSSKAKRAEIHESKMEGGMMRMAKLENLPLPAGATTTLASGGLHIMLFDLDPALKAGDSVPLTLEFADGDSLRMEAIAQTVAGSAGGH